MKEYILKFVDPQVVIQEEAKEDFKDLMDWGEEEFMFHVFVRLSEDVNCTTDKVKGIKCPNNCDTMELYDFGNGYFHCRKCSVAFKPDDDNCTKDEVKGC